MSRKNTRAGILVYALLMFFWYAPANVDGIARSENQLCFLILRLSPGEMELALNLVWAVIAVVSYVSLFRHFVVYGTEDLQRPTRRQSFIALTCALAILFPVISLTDDLHEIQATAEDASSAGLVIKRCVAGQSTASARSLHQAFLVFAPFVSTARMAEFGGLPEQPILTQASAVLRFAFSRPPPSVLFSQTT